MQSVQLIYGHSQCKTIPFTGNGADAWPGVSEVEDEVGCGGQLVGMRPVVVGAAVPGVVEEEIPSPESGEVDLDQLIQIPATAHCSAMVSL